MSFRKYFVFFALFFFGFAYRYFLAINASAGNFWDMEIFHNYALKILSGIFDADCCFKNLGYPFFLALIYKIFGSEHLSLVRLIQIILDLISAFLVYLSAKNIFKSKNAALISFLLYIINPLTSSFTGLRLSEILTVFYLSLAMFIASSRHFNRNFLLWFIIGIILGLLIFTRMQFYFFSMVFPVFLAVLYFGKMNKIRFIVIAYTGLLLASSYSLYTYKKKFNVYTVKPPYVDAYCGSLYAAFYNDVRYPELVDYYRLNVKFMDTIKGFYNVQLKDIPAYEENCRKMFLERIKTDWPVFTVNTFRNIYWLWDKEYLYTYSDVFYPNDKFPVKIWNIAIISLYVLGLFMYIKRNKKAVSGSPAFILTVLLFLGISSFGMVSNESRHTVAYYSIIMIWAGYGVEKLVVRLRHGFHLREDYGGQVGG